MEYPGASESLPAIAYCAERQRLLEAFTQAMAEVTLIQQQQMAALIAGDEDFSRFDILLHIAQSRKDQAKYAYIAHVESHGC
jgi:hypothetical protein